MYIGLISGTSMDAVNAALAEIEGDRVRVLASHLVPLPDPLAARLRSLATPGGGVVHGGDPIDELGELDGLLGELFAGAALGLLTASGLEPGAIRAIGSHGQTVRHRPRAAQPFTLQIGDPNIIAERTGIPVVADLRRRDMALGGEGAPLAPAFHAAVFSSPTEPRAVVNLGGIANVTLLLPGRPVTGFDTGPANGLMDRWTQRHRGEPFDRDGSWAATGTVSAALLARLMAHPFLALAPPKSTGPEDFNPAWLDACIAAGEPLPPVDVQATLCEFSAASVAAGLAGAQPARLIACGGGALNRELLGRIAARLPDTRVESSIAHGIDPQQVEAAAFAWLAACALAGRPGNLPAVTGARAPVVLGAVWPGRRR